MINVCMCGVQQGYPHLRECPYPYYGCNQRLEEQWIADMRVFREAQAKLDAIVKSNLANAGGGDGEEE